MARYFFDTRDGVRDRDYEGVELPDIDAARVEAIKFAGDYVSGQPMLLGHTGNLIVDLLDEKREPLFRVTISVANLAGLPTDVE